MDGEILLGVHLPIDGLRSMKSSLIYDLASSEKSLIVTLDNAVQHYRTTARVSMDKEAGLATRLSSFKDWPLCPQRPASSSVSAE